MIPFAARQPKHRNLLAETVELCIQQIADLQAAIGDRPPENGIHPGWTVDYI